MLVAQLCPTLCDPMDCGPPGGGPPGFSVRGISQARILMNTGEFPTQGLNPDRLHWQADSLPSEPPGDWLQKQDNLVLLVTEKSIPRAIGNFRCDWEQRLIGC